MTWNTCITKAYSSMGDSSKGWGPGAHTIAQGQLSRLGVSFPDAQLLAASWSFVSFIFSFFGVGCSLQVDLSLLHSLAVLRVTLPSLHCS